MTRVLADSDTVPATDAAPRGHAYREFVGHELRSPLTAIRTALEALAEDLEVVDDRSGGAARMLEIALRNTHRLADAVDWHQQVLELAEIPAVIPRRLVSLAELADALAAAGRVAVADTHADVLIETDPHLVGAVVAQFRQVLTLVRPGAEIRLQLAVTDADWSLCFETLAPPPGDGGRGPQTGIDDLRRLAGFLVPPAALGALGARLEFPDDPAVPLVLCLARAGSGAGPEH